jgi:uncharacterized protein DUF2752
MRVIFKQRKTGEIEYGIIYGGISIIALCIARSVPVLSLAPSCVFKVLTGFPCPTCGATHSVVALARGEVTASFMMNPLMALCLLAGILVFIYSLVALTFNLPHIYMILSSREQNALKTGAIILILAQWAYLITTR